MSQIATSIEQGRRLLALGISGATADMCHIFTDYEGEYISYADYIGLLAEGQDCDRCLKLVSDGDFDHSFEKDCPAWSLSALLDVIKSTLDDEDDFSMLITPTKVGADYTASGASRFAYADFPIEVCIKTLENLHKAGML
jgi:hypothetical protein